MSEETKSVIVILPFALFIGVGGCWLGIDIWLSAPIADSSLVWAARVSVGALFIILGIAVLLAITAMGVLALLIKRREEG